MGVIKKPLLASPAVLEKIKYPVLATPKLDGIRALKVDGKLVSRKFKPIPNQWIAKQLEKYLPEGADGEILSGKTFQSTTSAVMSIDKPDVDFTYYWFDWVYRTLKTPYKKRVKRIEGFYSKGVSTYGAETDEEFDWAMKSIKTVIPILVENEEQLLLWEKVYLAQGYEGIMIRDPEGPYKCGRSSVNQGILLKIKRFVDAEAKITGFVEMMHNKNEAKKDAFGRTERSSSKEGKVPAGTLGKILAIGTNGTYKDVDIEMGTGLDFKLRQEIWDNQDKYLGRLVKYKYQEQGQKDLPRFPVFLGFRHEDDM